MGSGFRADFPEKAITSAGPRFGRERGGAGRCSGAMTFLTGLFALGFALIHVTIGRLRFLGSVPRSIWLSVAGGVAVAYVFLHVLPDLAAHQRRVAEGFGLSAELAEGAVFATGLAGLTVFYGLERMAKASRHRSRSAGGEDSVEAGVFWIHTLSFAIYNVLIGYLLVHREAGGPASVWLFFVAMATHFVTNDFGLRQDHVARYDAVGRWLIAGAVLGGWMLGVRVTVPDPAVALLFAFLAGGVVLNVLKEELPEERQSRFLPFALGAAGYGVVLVAVKLV